MSMIRKFVIWSRLVIRWARILANRSYYHQPLGLGKAFAPNKIAGYFNDMIGKTKWTGCVDPEGFPICVLADGRRIYFTTTIVQKALGHWDRWVLNGEVSDQEEFLKLCRWLLDRQDEYGGWPIWKELGISTRTPYSAMTQGQCVSAFVRAWQLTGLSEFAEGAFRALHVMYLPIEKGGTAIYEGEKLYLEETPMESRSTILNGWIYALFGIYDFWLAFQDPAAFKIFSQSLRTLKECLPEYDAGYWSYYDARRHLASFFYHDLHIHQLRALEMIDGDTILRSVRERWNLYRRDPKNQARAFVVKAFQKLREPGEAVIVS